ncbi:ATP-binding protein [Actinosynnema sp. NPDC023794]
MSAHLVSPELVGRSAQLGHLAGAFDHAPATVLVGGEAGVGKSRLVEDFTARPDATVPLGGCVELDGLPFAPFVGALVDGAAELSLEELLLSRVERLDPDAVALVRAAAVGGRRVSHEILGGVHDVTPMRSVVDGGVMVVDGDGYAFRQC